MKVIIHFHLIEFQQKQLKFERYKVDSPLKLFLLFPIASLGFREINCSNIFCLVTCSLNNICKSNTTQNRYLSYCCLLSMNLAFKN